MGPRTYGYHERMSITVLLSTIVFVALFGLCVAILVGGALYVRRIRRDGPEAVLAGARRHRELRD
mgnify:FL=1